jgi:hypothetical protein
MQYAAQGINLALSASLTPNADNEPECPYEDGSALATLWREATRLQASIEHKEKMAADYERKAFNLRDALKSYRAEVEALEAAIEVLSAK